MRWFTSTWSLAVDILCTSLFPLAPPAFQTFLSPLILILHSSFLLLVLPYDSTVYPFPSFFLSLSLPHSLSPSLFLSPILSLPFTSLAGGGGSLSDSELAATVKEQLKAWWGEQVDAWDLLRIYRSESGNTYCRSNLVSTQLVKSSSFVEDEYSFYNGQIGPPALRISVAPSIWSYCLPHTFNRTYQDTVRPAGSDPSIYIREGAKGARVCFLCLAEVQSRSTLVLFISRILTAWFLSLIPYLFYLSKSDCARHLPVRWPQRHCHPEWSHREREEGS
jgi:hypothetical protein